MRCCFDVSHVGNYRPESAGFQISLKPLDVGLCLLSDVANYGFEPWSPAAAGILPLNYLAMPISDALALPSLLHAVQFSSLNHQFVR